MTGFYLAENWTKHERAYWEGHARNAHLPLWLRVVSQAHACHQPNRHTPFAPGELALAVAAVDKRTGELVPPNTEQLAKAISTAVNNGMLHAGSCSSCLIVPWGVHGGKGSGSETDPCSQRHSKRRLARKLSESDRRTVES